MIYLSNTEQAFIQANRTADVRSLLLRTHPANLDIRKLAAQISARQKARDKLPTWYANEALVFPPSLSVEQASSERTAHYKASLVQGKRLVDLTGGMGVDTWAFAQRVDEVLYVEQQADLAELAAHNLPLLNATNVQVVQGDGLTILDKPEFLTSSADWVYIDPHRRNEQGGKVVQLEDCEPDLSKSATISSLFEHTRQILVKASPLLDIHLAVRQLAGMVNEVHIVAVQGEVKEILFVLSHPSATRQTGFIKAVNLTSHESIKFTFNEQEERDADVLLGDPQTYLYEPNAAVLKAGAFRLIGQRFGLLKVAPHSHLYTSPTLVRDFPGRIFKLQSILKPDAKLLRQVVPDGKANLTVRNFPQTVAELRKKLSLREGGSIYILATTLQNGDKRLLITQKVDQTHS
ncbi:THUMP-like domain-containing protein [Spirosoma panaciterrae]|uniref:THUMP-like domain-containing protein n=1 Tax=Spirosoma panaciterrae TaxID=496058 RepID=UPI00036C00CF|nr:class I SAM-dependent methyltransferase [Spirosoma panaciterrae]